MCWRAAAAVFVQSLGWAAESLGRCRSTHLPPARVRGRAACLTVGASIYATNCPLACLVQMAAHTLAEYIAFLATRTVNDIPARIQGENAQGAVPCMAATKAAAPNA